MKTNNTILSIGLGRKLAIIFLITAVSAMGAFATLGDGSLRKDRPSRSLLTNKTQANSFSLRSGYSFRGNQVVNFNEHRYVNLNTTLTYQKGSTT